MYLTLSILCGLGDAGVDDATFVNWGLLHVHLCCLFEATKVAKKVETAEGTERKMVGIKKY